VMGLPTHRVWAELAKLGALPGRGAGGQTAPGC